MPDKSLRHAIAWWAAAFAVTFAAAAGVTACADAHSDIVNDGTARHG